MIVYVVLYDRPIGYNGYCETEVVGVFKNKEDAEEWTCDSDNYRFEEWYVSGTGPQTEVES